MRKLLITMLALGLSACGSFTTVGSSDQKVSADLRRQNTYCESMPRVYSGVAYNFCHLHSHQDDVSLDWFLGFYLLDSVASAVVDTALLPYTGYRQYEDGCLKVQR